MSVVKETKSRINEANSMYKLYKNYFVIAMASLIAVFFFPMLGTYTSAGFLFPNSAVGWVVYVVTKLLVAGLNMLIFHSFMCQGKLNVKDNPYYIEACEILRRYGYLVDNREPLSPEEWLAKEYRTKGVLVTITSIVSMVCLTQAILTFDWISMLTYLFTVIMGVITGLFQQDTAEEYWTGDFWHYAKKIERQQLERSNQ